MSSKKKQTQDIRSFFNPTPVNKKSAVQNPEEKSIVDKKEEVIKKDQKKSENKMPPQIVSKKKNQKVDFDIKDDDFKKKKSKTNSDYKSDGMDVESEEKKKKGKKRLTKTSEYKKTPLKPANDPQKNKKDQNWSEDEDYNESDDDQEDDKLDQFAYVDDSKPKPQEKKLDNYMQESKKTEKQQNPFDKANNKNEALKELMCGKKNKTKKDIKTNDNIEVEEEQNYDDSMNSDLFNRLNKITTNNQKSGRKSASKSPFKNPPQVENFEIEIENADQLEDQNQDQVQQNNQDQALDDQEQIELAIALSKVSYSDEKRKSPLKTKSPLKSAIAQKQENKRISNVSMPKSPVKQSDKRISNVSLSKSPVKQADQKRTSNISLQKSPNTSTKKPAVSPNTKSNNKKDKPEKIVGTLPFSDKIFVITGQLSIERQSLDDIIKQQGGKVTSAVSGKTSYLIIGEQLEDGRAVNEGNKYKKAQEKKVTIFTEEDFSAFLIQKTGRDLQSHYRDPTGEKQQENNEENKSKENDLMNIEPEPQVKLIQDPEEARKIKEKQKNQLWTQRYAPQNLEQCIGNNASINKIKTWLEDWKDVNIHGNKKEIKFNSFNKNSMSLHNTNAKACLISGPPGIGKTTSVRLLAEKLGFELLEQNASDIRSKNAITTLLQSCQNSYFLGKSANSLDVKKNYVVLMDEVDGCSAGDRGGISALIQIIKNTRFPIICVCNDIHSTKVRSLQNSCYDIRFIRPQKNMISQRAVQICKQEGLKVDERVIDLLCESLGNDIRQILNYLQMSRYSNDQLQYVHVKNNINSHKKDDTVMISGFDAAKHLMCKFERDKLTLRQKSDLFFLDYDLIPLLIQENYLNCIPKDKQKQPIDISLLENVANSAAALAESEIINQKVRRDGEWGLLPQLGFMSSIYATDKTCFNIAFPGFPQWLGKNSSTTKVTREIRELRMKLGHHVTGSRYAVKFDYAKPLLDLILYHLKQGPEHIDDVIDVLDEYNLTLDDVKDHLCDVQFPKGNDWFSSIPTQTKSSLTRQYKKSHDEAIKKKKGKKDVQQKDSNYDPFAEEVIEDVESEKEESDDEIVESKKKTTKKAANAKGTKKAK